MKEWINGTCKISVKGDDGKMLYFLAKQVTSVTDSHITFLDKYNDTYTFNVSRVEEIQQYKQKNGVDE